MIEIRPVAPHMGAEVLGADVRALADADFTAIYDAFLHRNVLVVRGQHDLEPEELLGFAGRFGRLKPHIAKGDRHPELPELMILDNGAKPGAVRDETRVGRGVGWHSDLVYEPEPAKATLLYARALPSRGGDTLFVDLHAAWEALPEALRTRVERLSAVYRYGGREGRELALLDVADRDRALTAHPLLRLHPETGRPILFLSPKQCAGIAGMASAEGDALVEEICGHVLRPERQYRHRWQDGDIVIWDNRCSLHTGTDDYPAHERRMHWRVTVMSDGRERSAAA